jgi:hypothetical protein
VVAGSWHIGDGESFVNASRVMDGHGVPLAEYHKRMAFGGNGRPHERIRSGKRFPILLAPEGMIAFAICLDFCDQNFENAYGKIDVDFFLVPSCGNKTTIRGHIGTADIAFNRYSTVTFVSQQAWPKESRGLGYVLFRDGEAPVDVTSTVKTVTWIDHFIKTSFQAVDRPGNKHNVK